MACLTLKRGADLPLSARLTENGNPVDITGWTVECWLRDKNRAVVHKYTVTITNPVNGEWEASAPGSDTIDWPIGEILGDVRYIDTSGRVMYTSNFEVKSLDPQTTP